jgi:hypothetical protein
LTSRAPAGARAVEASESWTGAELATGTSQTVT